MRQHFSIAPPDKAGREPGRAALWYNVVEEKCDSISRLRRRKALAENPAGWRYGIINPAKPDLSKNDCRAKGPSCRFAPPSFFSPASIVQIVTLEKCRQAFSVAPPVKAGIAPGRADISFRSSRSYCAWRRTRDGRN